METAFLILESISREKDIDLCNSKGKTALFFAKDPKMLYLLLEYVPGRQLNPTPLWATCLSPG